VGVCVGALVGVWVGVGFVVGACVAGSDEEEPENKVLVSIETPGALVENALLIITFSLPAERRKETGKVIGEPEVVKIQ
jgi:hypothetical protein